MSDLKKIIHAIRDAELTHSDIHQLLEMLTQIDWIYTAHIGGLRATKDITSDDIVLVKVRDVLKAQFPHTFEEL